MQMICNKFKKIISFLPLTLLMSCSSEINPETIFVSSYPVYYLVKEVVGNLSPIEVITPPGVEAHDYEISPRKLASIYEGKGLFINGLGLEPYQEALPKSILSKTFVLSNNIETIKTDNKVDPHIWLDPLRAIEELSIVKEAMITLDPKNTESYLSNYQDASNRFKELHEKYEVERKDFKKDTILVAHAAFGYLCDRYDLNQIHISGIDSEAEPTAKTLESIIEAIKEYNINTIFTEEIGSKEIGEKISKLTGAKLETLSTLEDDEDNSTYVSLMDENLKKISEACK